VLKDPEPHVYFLNFGESTLDHELRMHVRDLGDRNPVIDEVNRFINREFKKHTSTSRSGRWRCTSRTSTARNTNWSKSNPRQAQPAARTAAAKLD
jgi:small-conductance mechanosensitive channel